MQRVSITEEEALDGLLMFDEMPLRGWINGTGDGHSSPVRGDHDLAGIG